jgi:hypothetical protein
LQTKDDNDSDENEETTDAAMVRALQSRLPPKVQSLVVNLVSDIPSVLATVSKVLTPARVASGAVMLKAAKEARAKDWSVGLGAITTLLESGDQVSSLSFLFVDCTACHFIVVQFPLYCLSCQIRISLTVRRLVRRLSPLLSLLAWLAMQLYSTLESKAREVLNKSSKLVT